MVATAIYFGHLNCPTFISFVCPYISILQIFVSRILSSI